MGHGTVWGADGERMGWRVSFGLNGGCRNRAELLQNSPRRDGRAPQGRAPPCPPPRRRPAPSPPAACTCGRCKVGVGSLVRSEKFRLRSCGEEAFASAHNIHPTQVRKSNPTHRCSIVRPWIVTAAAPAASISLATAPALILSSFSPDRILTVTGNSEPATIPATRRASLVGFRRRTAPRPRRVASGVWGLGHRSNVGWM
jgi:hypothetical protein